MDKSTEEKIREQKKCDKILIDFVLKMSNEERERIINEVWLPMKPKGVMTILNAFLLGWEKCKEDKEKQLQDRTLTKKEKQYICSELFCSIDTCRYVSADDINLDNFHKAKFQDYDMESEDEFNLVKSIIKKLLQQPKSSKGENKNARD